MKKPLFIVFLLLILVFLSASFSPVPFVRGETSLSVSISPPSASIDFGESVNFNSTVAGGTSPYAFQWFLNGSFVNGADSESWTFTPPSIGVYSVHLRVNDSATDVMESEPAQVIVGGHSIAGSFGYSTPSNEAGASGTQYTAFGSRFMLNLEANVTSISCLMIHQDNLNPDRLFSYSFAIYTATGGSVGNLVAQTSQGQMSYYNNVELWYTLSFSSAVHLEPGAYWLMVVHDASNYVLVYHNATESAYPSVFSAIGGMTFPPSLPSPIYESSNVYCIYASWTVDVDETLSEGNTVFSLTSNSTISSLAFNSAANELSFEVSGPSDTTGYTEVFISKTLLPNFTGVNVLLDGEQLNFSASSIDDSWCLHFVYPHSTHDVVINMQSDAIPEFPEAFLAIFITIAFTALLCLSHKTRKTLQARHHTIHGTNS